MKKNHFLKDYFSFFYNLIKNVFHKNNNLMNIFSFNYENKIKNFDKALNNVLLNLAKRVVSDGEGASKFITINVSKCKNEIDAKKIALSVANSPLVKTAIAGEDPNWGRVIMAIGKAGPKINLNKLSFIIYYLNYFFYLIINKYYQQ